MPILFVNGKRRGLRVRGRARVNPTTAPRRKPTKSRSAYLAHLRYLARLRKGGRKRPVTSNPAKRHRKSPARVAAGKRLARLMKRRRGGNRRSRARAHDAGFAALAAYNRGKRTRKRGRSARRSEAMAKKRKKSSKRSLAMRRRWRARKKAGLIGLIGRTKRRRRGRKAAPRKRRARARRTRGSTSRARAAKKGWRRRRARSPKTYRAPRRRRYRRLGATSHRAMLDEFGFRGATKSLRKNPSRKRRRGRKGRRRYGRRVTHRKRRYYGRRRHGGRRRGRRGSARRSYRRNPGNMILDLAKKAIPVLAAWWGTKLVVRQLAPMIPGVSSLGALAAPVVSVAAIFGANFATKKVGFLAKHKSEIMLGTAGALIESLVQAFAPASIKAMIGMSDYVQMGDYIAVGGAPPINDSMTLSDYIAVGGDGVEEELGLEEELGVEEELGNDLLGGVSSTSLMKRVPSQRFLAPVPARSFTKVIPPAGSGYDSPGELYGGIFGGGFGR